MAKKPALKLVGSSLTGIQPPRDLGPPGRALWDRVQSEYDVRDVGGCELLALACAALDRCETIREQIEREGQTIRAKSGLRDHPLLRHEAVARAFVVRTIQKLGLDVEPVRSGPGRPGGFPG